jgi:hypothetical protein
MYDSIDYANQRLAGTIITYDNEPVTVVNCGGRNTQITAEVCYLKDNNVGKVLLKNCDITPVKLGFVNTNYGVGYLGRIPLRKDWKQGLRLNTLRSMWGVDARWVNNKNLRNCIVASYPTFARALEDTVNDRFPVAFSRTFSLAYDDDEDKVLLNYKWMGAVGDVVNGKPQLYDKYGFLIEALDEVMAG